MKKITLFCLLAFMATTFYCQVGIGTITPSEAAMLEVSSQTNGAGPYRGFMPPRVPDLVARNAINPNILDTGLLIYVENTGCLQIWNGAGWESIHCINTVGFVDLFQNFDLNTTWGYSLDIPFFDNGTDGFYGITDNSRTGFGVIASMTNNFLGIHDLDDEGDNGTTGFATITFNTLNISASSYGLTISFNYDFYEFDSGDQAYYTLVIDGIAQPEVTLIIGAGNLSLSGTISESIPIGAATVSLSIKIKQNGADDYAGFDNFAIVAD